MSKSPSMQTASPRLGSIRHYVYALIVLVLWMFAMDRDYDAALTTERMTREQVEAKARNYASTLVACTKGIAISVGDILIDCHPMEIPEWRKVK